MGGTCCSSKPPVVISPQTKTPIRRSTHKSSAVASRISSASLLRESSSDSPLSNTGISKTNPLNLIRGYENVPLVTLEEALAPFDGEIEDLADKIREAKSKCYYPDKPKLTLDESAAIYIYTMRWDNGCLYDHLQDAWKSEDPARLRPWFKYLKLFKSAFDKLPKAEGEIWLGKAFDERLEDELYENQTSLYTAMDVFSSSRTFVEADLDDRNVENKVLFGFGHVNGRLVQQYGISNGTEVLVFPGTKLGMLDDMKRAPGMLMIHLTGPTPPPPKSKTPLPTPLPNTPANKAAKHFQCLNDRCNHRCLGNHESNHCTGFERLLHSWKHQCGPRHLCLNCSRHSSIMYECKNCRYRFCDDCVL